MKPTREQDSLVSQTGEMWLPIPSVPGYEASSLGRIRHAGRRVPLKLTPSGRLGYLHFTVNADARLGRRRMTLTVHRAVCEAFNGVAPSSTHQAAHNNGNPVDNEASNLRWATPGENTQDMLSHGTWVGPPTRRGEAGTAVKLTEAEVREIRLLEGRVSHRVVAAMYGVSPSAIRWVWQRRTWAQVA